MQTETSTGFATSVFTEVSSNEEEYVFKRVMFSVKDSFGQQAVVGSIEATDEQVVSVLDEIQIRNRKDK